ASRTGVLPFQMGHEAGHPAVAILLRADRPGESIQQRDKYDLLTTVLINQVREPQQIRRAKPHTGEFVESHEIEPDRPMRRVDTVNFETAQVRVRWIQELAVQIGLTRGLRMRGLSPPDHGMP